MSARRGPRWVDRNEINREFNIKKLLFKALVQWYENAKTSNTITKVQKMTLASGILFMVWCSIIFVAIGGHAMMTIIKQEKSLYSNWDDDEGFQDEVGQ